MKQESTAANESRRPTSTLRCIVNAVLILAMGLLIHRTRSSTNDASSAREDLSNAQRESRQKHQQVVHDFEQYYTSILTDLHTGSELPPYCKPLSAITLRHMRNQAQAFESYLAESKELTESADIALRHRTLMNHSQVMLLQNRFEVASTSLEDARKLSAAHPEVFQGAELLVAKAIVDSRLGWLLGMRGQIEAGLDATNSAIQSLREVANYLEPASQAHQELAVALRNAGLLLAASGKDGTSRIQQSLKATQALIQTAGMAVQYSADKPNCEAFIQFNSFHIDSSQILLAMLWQLNRYEEARTLGEQSLGLLDQLKEQVALMAARTKVQFPMLRYKIARRMAAANLNRISETDPTQKQAIPADWVWRPLSVTYGRTLAPSLLLGGKLHAEFETQQCLMLTWIDQQWANEAVIRIAAATNSRIQIVICAASDTLERAAMAALTDAGVDARNVSFKRIDTDTFWIRDFGPTVVETANEQFAAVDTLYRSDRSPNEEVVPYTAQLGMPVIPASVFLQGGSLLTNGAGLCLVSQDVLTQHKATGDSEPVITNTIKRITGAEAVVYLAPLAGEPTGHLDWFATFTSPGTLVIGEYKDGNSANAALLDKHAKTLQGLPTSEGPLKVVRIPMPTRQDHWFGGTFTNVVFANGVLLMPTWSSATPALTREAKQIFQQLLPTWKVVGIDCSELGIREGALHCATMNLYRSGHESR